MVENEAGPDGFGYTVADKMTLFYAYYGLIESTDPVWLQWVFDILIGIFERFGIINNMENMVTMVCQPGPLFPCSLKRAKYEVEHPWCLSSHGELLGV